MSELPLWAFGARGRFGFTKPAVGDIEDVRHPSERNMGNGGVGTAKLPVAGVKSFGESDSAEGQDPDLTGRLPQTPGPMCDVGCPRLPTN